MHRTKSSLLSPDLIAEAERQFTICNACRYCEGLCAVFPALERRLSFHEGDVAYLANLCHDCRACFDACPFATPHEFAVDIPPLMSQIREETYESCTIPRSFVRLQGLWGSFLLTVAAVALVVLGIWVGVGTDTLFARHDGPGAFYEIVPYAAMSLPALAITGLAVVAMVLGGRRYWRATSESPVPRARSGWWQTLVEVLSFKYMRGGGPGCNYPREPLSQGRRLAHALVFYGFGAALASTTTAAIYENFFDLEPPYHLLSLPVVLGIAGGVLMIVGCGTMVSQKARSRSSLETPRMKSMDMAFILLLLVVNLTGMVLLVLRSTAAMGILLAVHLGVVVAVFATLPYGKFVHGVYRSMALYRNAAEQAVEDRTTVHA